MKKIFGIFSIVVLSLVLTACGDEAIEYEPITVSGSGFEIEIEVGIDKENINNQIANILEEKPYPVEITEEMINEILSELEITTQEIDLVIEKVNAEFTNVNEDIGELELPSTIEAITVTLEKNNDDPIRVIFNDLEFEHAGIFTYRISINEENETTEYDNEFGWILDNNVFYITITITENETLEILEAVIDTQNIKFVNTYIPNVTYEVETLIAYIWENMVTLAYNEGYEHVLNDENTYERVAIYIPEPEENNVVADNNDAITAGNNNSTANNNNATAGNNNNSGANNNATTSNNNNSNTNNNATTSNNNNSTANNNTTTSNNNNNSAANNNATAGNNNNNNSANNNTTNTPPPANPTPTPAPPPECRPIDNVNQNNIVNTLETHGRGLGATLNTRLNSSNSGFELAFQSVNFSCDWITNQKVIDEIQFRMSRQLSSDHEFRIRWENTTNGNFNIWLYR